MNPSELRASLALSSIFALRMLGLFLILPIFSLHAKGLPDGDNATLVGLTMGIYGMVQAFFHIPLGLLSDRYGRRVIVAFGLSLFIIGALIAASHDDLWWIMFGRAIQGAGAISAAISAWVADLTREEVRTRAMALIGGSIAISFALSVVIATPLYHALGMPGIFWMMAILGCISLWVALQFVPTASMPVLSAPNGVRGHLNQLKKVFQNPELVRLNIGVLVLHTSQVALFLVIPRLLDEVGLPIADHWLVYLSVLVASLIIMMPMMMQAERKNRLALLVKVSIGLMCCAQLYFAVVLIGQWSSILNLCVGLLIFFIGFNLLEALQPSLVSRYAGENRGAGLGIYNTTMSIGLFLGGILGGWLYGSWGPNSIFYVDIGLLMGWLIIALGMTELPKKTNSLKI
ncbi:MAG: MFS transporter [Burkholderiales bacterium]|jgi:predicted MFS family arabinose efflux permease|nr:MFS transporter [Burkholderiales bacterium]